MRHGWLIGPGIAFTALFVAAAVIVSLPAVGARAAAVVSAARQDAAEPCLYVDGGTLSGSVAQRGAPAPDGTLLTLVFSGGPAENAITESGHYTAAVLARACADGVHWVPFELWSGGQAEQGVTPEGWETHLDLDAPEAVSIENPASFQTGPPALCALELGTVSGAVQIDGAPAPDGTVVVATTTTTLMQTVLTSGGRYLVTSVGNVCTGGRESFIAMTLSAAGTSVTITPSQETTSQDLAGSSAATTTQAPATDGQ